MKNQSTDNKTTHEAQKELQDIIDNKQTELVLSTGRKIRIGWLCADAQDKIDSVVVHHDDVAKSVESGDVSIQDGNKCTRQFYAKIAAAILLNNYFGLKLFWWLKWRIIHHFWHLNGEDYMKIIVEGKKKATESQYCVAMAYSMTMSDIWKMLTKKEAEAFHRELNSVREQQP